MQALTQIATDEFLSLPFLQPSEFGDGVNANGVAQRADQLRVTAAVWGARDARINTVSPGIIFTPMSLTDLAGPSGASMCSTIQISVIGRLGSPYGIAAAVAFLIRDDGCFSTGTDFVVTGDEIAAMRTEQVPDASELADAGITLALHAR